jgi:hypothetical protein
MPLKTDREVQRSLSDRAAKRILEITISPKQYRTLRRAAEEAGTTVDNYASKLITDVATLLKRKKAVQSEPE